MQIRSGLYIFKFLIRQKQKLLKVYILYVSPYVLSSRGFSFHYYFHPVNLYIWSNPHEAVTEFVVFADLSGFKMKVNLGVVITAQKDQLTVIH